MYNNVEHNATIYIMITLRARGANSIKKIGKLSL